MFVCQRCLNNYEEVLCRLSSFGKCEVCGSTLLCADVNSSSLIKKIKVDKFGVMIK